MDIKPEFVEKRQDPLKDILKIIREKWDKQNGQFTQFNFKVTLNTEEVPMIEFHTIEHAMNEKGVIMLHENKDNIRM